MSVAYVVVGFLLAMLLMASAGAKLTHNKRVVDGLTSIGLPLRMLPFLAACEIAGAAGLLVGLWYAPLGIAAAIGVVVYFVLAVGAHLRKSDFKGTPAPIVFLIFAAAALSLQVL